MQNQDEERAWQAIRTQRLAVADLLESMDAAEWRHPSLCEGWSVQDVAAHLILQQLGALGRPRHVRAVTGRHEQSHPRGRSQAGRPDLPAGAHCEDPHECR